MKGILFNTVQIQLPPVVVYCDHTTLQLCGESVLRERYGLLFFGRHEKHTRSIIVPPHM